MRTHAGSWQDGEKRTLPALLAGSQFSDVKSRAQESLDWLNLGSRLQHYSPQLSGGEMQRTRTTQIIFWEGSVPLSGRAGKNVIDGVGYVEMTGYAHPFELLD